MVSETEKTEKKSTVKHQVNFNTYEYDRPSVEKNDIVI
jgi:hypothetical protein